MAAANDTSTERERKNFKFARASRRRERVDYWRARFASLAVQLPAISIPTPPANLDAAHKEARKAAHLAAIAKFGTGPLPINPATGKRWSGTGKYPKSGIRSPVHPVQSELSPVVLEGRWRNRRERAAELRERMAVFAAIYNAGWLVRDSYFGSRQLNDQRILQFVAVLISELRDCRDAEALMFAVADALTASKHGVPWDE